MPRRYREARLLNKLKVAETVNTLGITQPTLNAWKTERKVPSIESLEKMADLYSVTTDYLLGRPDVPSHNPSQPVTPLLLKIMNGHPVWSPVHGWMLVNSTGQHLLCADGTSIPFSDADDIFITPKSFSGTFPYPDQPLSQDELLSQTEVWLEPISPDSNLRSELRGLYQLKGHFFENEYGNRFYMGTYGAKWLAFKKT